LVVIAALPELTQQELARLNAELQQEHELYLDTLETEMP
jgi:hypothetical protein